MAHVHALATHLPVWGSDAARLAGPDEDAITLGVAAGRAALDIADVPVSAVVLVSRDLPFLEGGGSEAVLLAGLGLGHDVRCSLVVGGAPAALDAVATGTPGTLVIAADVTPSAGAAAAVLGDAGSTVTPSARVGRSLPVQVRDTGGRSFGYDDPRLLRTRGVAAAIGGLGLTEKPVAVAGLGARDAAGYVDGPPTPLPTTGSSAALFALADVLDRGVGGTVVAVEEASAVAVRLDRGETRRVSDTPAARPLPARRQSAAADVKISLPAYERAFDSKVGLQAGRCTVCGALDLPPRYRCSGCGAENSHELTPLPRACTVYTAVSVHVPVPGLLTPYDLAIVEIAGTGVRLLAPVTGAPPGSVDIDDAGTLVLRRIATRSGVADYGYAFLPDAGRTASTGSTGEGAAA